MSGWRATSGRPSIREIQFSDVSAVLGTVRISKRAAYRRLIKQLRNFNLVPYGPPTHKWSCDTARFAAMVLSVHRGNTDVISDGKWFKPPDDEYREFTLVKKKNSSRQKESS